MRPSIGERAAQFEIGRVARRDVLKTGASLLAGAALPINANAATSGQPTESAKSVLFVQLVGGASHLETYDLKPNAPAEVRGEFRPIRTNVPGMYVCEMLPRHARIADKFAVVHGVATIDTHDPRGLLSGFAPHEDRPMLTESIRTWRPKINSHNPTTRLLHALEAAVTSSSVAHVRFDGDALPGGDWDTHGGAYSGGQTIFQNLRAKLPVYDAAIATLIETLYDRGLDRDVLVVAAGEFGRTPRVNRHGGRDHWSPCGSVLFAGGGLRMGQTIGDTGPIGERSGTHDYTAQHVLATIYHTLGMNPAGMVPGARPIWELCG